MSHQIIFKPAANAESYEIEIRKQRVTDERSYFMVRAKACRQHEPGLVECGDWSEYSEPFYVPEPPQALGLVALLLGLGLLYWWRRPRK